MLSSNTHKTPEEPIAEASNGQASAMEVDAPTSTIPLQQSEVTPFITASSYNNFSFSLWQKPKNAAPTPAPQSGNKRKRSSSEGGSSKKKYKRQIIFYYKDERPVEESVEVHHKGRRHYVERDGKEVPVISYNTMMKRRFRYLNGGKTFPPTEKIIKEGEKDERRYFVMVLGSKKEVARGTKLEIRKRKNEQFKFYDNDDPIPITAIIIYRDWKFFASMEDGSKKEVVRRNVSVSSSDQPSNMEVDQDEQDVNEDTNATSSSKTSSRKKSPVYYYNLNERVEKGVKVHDEGSGPTLKHYVMRNNEKISVATLRTLKRRCFYYVNDEKQRVPSTEEIHEGNGENEPRYYVITSDSTIREVVTGNTLGNKNRKEYFSKYIRNRKPCYYYENNQLVEEGTEVFRKRNGLAVNYYVIINNIETRVLNWYQRDNKNFYYLNGEKVDPGVKVIEKITGKNIRYFIFQENLNKNIQVFKWFVLKYRIQRNERFKFFDSNDPIPITARIIRRDGKRFAEMEDGSEKEVIERYNNNNEKQTERPLVVELFPELSELMLELADEYELLEENTLPPMMPIEDSIIASSHENETASNESDLNDSEFSFDPAFFSMFLFDDKTSTDSEKNDDIDENMDMDEDFEAFLNRLDDCPQSP